MSFEVPPSNFQLSVKAVRELRGISRKEYPGEAFTDEDVHALGVRLLRLFSILLSPPSVEESSNPLASARLTDQECKALAYLNEPGNEKPSISTLTRALGYRSPRTGLRIVKALMTKGLVFRDANNELRLTDTVNRTKASPE